MNGKKARDINKLADSLLKDWIIRNTNNKEDFNEADLDKYLPKDTHFTDETGCKTNFYTKKWTIRKLKKILKRQGSIPKTLTIEEIIHI